MVEVGQSVGLHRAVCYCSTHILPVTTLLVFSLQLPLAVTIITELHLSFYSPDFRLVKLIVQSTEGNF